jgi:hypothetical protein
VRCFAGVSLDTFEGVAESARLAMTLLRPGSLGWWRAMAAAVIAETTNPSRMFELLSLNGSTDPEPDARIAFIETQIHVFAIFARSAPQSALMAYLDRVSTCVERMCETVPAARRYSLLVRGVVTMWRYPRPWSAMTDLDEATRLAQEVGDRRTEHMVRINGADLLFRDLGDADLARRRMLALEEALSQSQEALAVAICALYVAGLLAAAPDEQAWDQAEAIAARVLSSTGGRIGIPPVAQGVLARTAMNRGHLEKAEALARAALDMLGFMPLSWTVFASVRIRALIGLGRAAEAAKLAEQLTSTLQMLGGAGIDEVQARLATVAAFEANGDGERARTELAETLSQVQLRLDDIAEPFWKNSYLTRNPHVAHAIALGEARGLPPLTRP